MPPEKQESGLEATEQQETPPVAESTPAPVVSESSGDQQPSATAGGLTEEQLQKLLEEREARLMERIERSLQSIKDRRISKLEKTQQEILALRQRLEEAGGDWDLLAREAAQSELTAKIEALENKLVELTTAPKAGSESWEDEWKRESQKILDEAKKWGVTLTPEEYRAALFTGEPFTSKGDAYAALQRAIFRKMKGESIPAAAVVGEGGEPAKPSEDLDFRQKFEQTLKKAGPNDAQQLLMKQWEQVGKELRKHQAREQLLAQGLSPEDLV